MHRTRVLIFSVFSVIFVAHCFAADGDDFRARQRTELATLPVPAVPPGDGAEIDRFIAARWAARNVTPPAVVDDRAFARRAFLDVIGLPPDRRAVGTIRLRQRAGQAREAGRCAAGRQAGLRRELDGVLERPVAQRRADQHRRPAQADHSLALPLSFGEQAARPVHGRVAEPRQGRAGRLPQGRQLARPRQRQPDARRCRRRRTCRRCSWPARSSAPRATTASSTTGSWNRPTAWPASSRRKIWKWPAATSRPARSWRRSSSSPTSATWTAERRPGDAAEGRGDDGDAAQEPAVRADDGEPALEAADGPRPVRAGRRLRRQRAEGRPARLAGLRFHGPRLRRQTHSATDPFVEGLPAAGRESRSER